jgi:hypothetical protein
MDSLVPNFRVKRTGKQAEVEKYEKKKHHLSVPSLVLGSAECRCDACTLQRAIGEVREWLGLTVGKGELDKLRLN